MITSTVRELFDRGTAAFNAHDMDGFAATMSDDVIVTAPAVRIEGKAAAVHFYQGWIQAFPDARVTITAVHILDDVAIEEGVFTGTHRGVLHSPAGDLPPTGRAVGVEYIQVLRFGDGRTIGFNLMFDRLTCWSSSAWPRARDMAQMTTSRAQLLAERFHTVVTRFDALIQSLTPEQWSMTAKNRRSGSSGTTSAARLRRSPITPLT